MILIKDIVYRVIRLANEAHGSSTLQEEQR
jgi:hypothetical protein